MPDVRFKKLKGSVLLKKYGQILYAAILIILIPGVIIGNTLWVINAFRSVSDTQLQRQGLIITEILNASGITSADDLPQVQQILERMFKSGTEELRSFDVIVPQGTSFMVSASSFPSNIGLRYSPTSTPAMIQNIGLAWATDQGIARLTTPSEGDVQNSASLEVRPYWNIIYPLFDETGNKFALLNLKMSTSFIDDRVTQALITSELILVATLVIVIALLLVNTRLFQYAFLFKKLQEVDQMKDEFISMASHELRTPITAIKGYISMFVDGSFGALSDAGQKGVSIIESSVRRLADLVEDLLNVSRIEQNRLQLKLDTVNLSASIAQTVDELSITAQSKNLSLTYTPDGSLPAVMADADKLRQVLVNLVGNAIKYTKEGSVTVNALVRDDMVVVKIKDTGIGMSATDRSQLFTKFYRVSSEATKGIVGTGLGLWITKQLITLMKGEIFVDSIEGVGTEVSFTLPIAHARASSEPKTEQQRDTA